MREAFDFADALRRLKAHRRWSDEDVRHALRRLGLDVQPETVRSWTYRKRTPNDIVKPLLVEFFNRELEGQDMNTEGSQIIISMTVTPEVVVQAKGRPDQRQIKVTPFQRWASYRRGRVVKLHLSSGMTLVQGDNTAVWASHNGKDFADFFRLLARNAGKTIRLEATMEKATLT